MNGPIRMTPEGVATAARHMMALQLTGATTDHVPLLRISRASGELKSIGISDGIAYHRFRVQIDGCVMVDAPLAATAGWGLRTNTGLTVGLRFEQSLLVEVKASVHQLPSSQRSVQNQSGRMSRVVRSRLSSRSSCVPTFGSS